MERGKEEGGEEGRDDRTLAAGKMRGRKEGGEVEGRGGGMVLIPLQQVVLVVVC